MEIKSPEIIPQEDGAWQVEIALPKEKIPDSVLLNIFREAKKNISTKYHVPLDFLRYRNIERHDIGTESARVSVLMVSEDPNANDPKFKLSGSKSETGEEFDNMIVKLELCPRMKNGDTVTVQHVEQALKKEGIKTEFVDFKRVQAAVNKSIKEHKPIKGLIIGKGKFPSPTVHGEIQYFCGVKEMDDGFITGTEKLESGQKICRKKDGVEGVELGMDIKGDNLFPVKPKEYVLAAGEKTFITRNGNEAQATHAGILRIRVTTNEKQPFKRWLGLSLDQIVELDGSSPLRITLDKPIEIKGGLKAGSVVVSQYEVIVEGDVDKDVSIQTAGNIIISGNIVGSAISGEKDVDVENAHSARIVAEGKLTIKGTAENSYISGNVVYVNNAVGCTIVAGDKIEVNNVEAGNGGFIGKFKAGKKGHLTEISQENRKFINYAENNLDNLKKLFGADIIQSLKSANISQAILKHMENLRKAGNQDITKEQRNAFLQLLEAVSPLKELMSDKRHSLKTIERRLKDVVSNPEIIFNNAVSGKVGIDLDGVEGEILPEDGVVIIELVDGKIIKKPYIPDEKITAE
ncbi:MAG: DUF342 domain-containing protein [FCB group bacterium]|nr:DUF342 domain-containing protein [FCB group bacterium]